MNRKHSNVIAVLDIGSSKVVCLIAKVLPSGDFETLGIGYHVAQGIKSGIISDIGEAEQSISKAVEAAEKMTGERVRAVFVSISPNNLTSQKTFTETTVTGREIQHKDLNKLLLEAIEYYQKNAIEIIHTFSCQYILDGRVVSNPLGMYGDLLGCHMHILSTSPHSLMNIKSCLNRCGLEVRNYVATIFASSLSCLREDESKLGVSVIDFGAGNTSIGVFENGQLVYADAVPLGGINITNDIAKGLSISFAEAERMKSLYGAAVASAIVDDEVIDLAQDDGAGGTIYRSELTGIISARLEEILELLFYRLLYNKITPSSKIVITGGGARMPGLKELIAELLPDTKVRVGMPKNMYKPRQQSLGMEFAVVIGMASSIAGSIANDPFFQQSKPSLLRRFSKWYSDIINA